MHILSFSYHQYSGRCMSLHRRYLFTRYRQLSLIVLLAITSLQLTGQTDHQAETKPESAGLVKNSLKPDYPPPEEVALTPIFASHREFLKSHMPSGQSPARSLPLLKDVVFHDKLNNQLFVFRNNPEVHANPLARQNEPLTIFSVADTTMVLVTDRSQKSGVYWQFSVGALTGKSTEDKSKGMISFRALTSYQFTRWFSAGIGIGADMLEYTVLPVFADLKLMLPVERSYYPYLYAKSGYSFPLKKSKETKFSTTEYFGGPMFGTGAGILLPGREDFRWYIEGGLRYSEIRMDLRHAGLFKRTLIYYYYRPELRLGVFFN